MMDGRKRGKIVTLLRDKFCGFIDCDDGPKGVFFHKSGLQVTQECVFEDLIENMRVEITQIEGKPGKGPRAVDVLVL